MCVHTHAHTLTGGVNTTPQCLVHNEELANAPEMLKPSSTPDIVGVVGRIVLSLLLTRSLALCWHLTHPHHLEEHLYQPHVCECLVFLVWLMRSINHCSKGNVKLICEQDSVCHEGGKGRTPVPQLCLSHSKQQNMAS